MGFLQDTGRDAGPPTSAGGLAGHRNSRRSQASRPDL